MQGLRGKKYIHTSRKRFDPASLLISIGGLLAVVAAIATSESNNNFFDVRSLIIIVGGTFASLLFQFDFAAAIYGMILMGRSFLGTPDKKILNVLRDLDKAIVTDASLLDMREGREINGEILNDVVYMHKQGLLFEEIDEFVTSRIADEYLGRQTAVTMLKRAATVAPSLGLLGTVVGLVGVLRSLQNPANIGPSMSLALLTTAYGSVLSSLVFTPMAGRLEHHNTIYLEVHKQLLSKVAILLNREERRMDRVHRPEVKAA